MLDRRLGALRALPGHAQPGASVPPDADGSERLAAMFSFAWLCRIEETQVSALLCRDLGFKILSLCISCGLEVVQRFSSCMPKPCELWSLLGSPVALGVSPGFKSILLFLSQLF